MREELLGWGDKTLRISKGKILPIGAYVDTVTLPKQAEVVVRESTPNWGGFKGITFFVEQTPSVYLSGGCPYRPKSFAMDTTALFGRMSSIYPDGTYWPAQLPRILEYVESDWGWTINQRVKDLVASGRPR